MIKFIIVLIILSTGALKALCATTLTVEANTHNGFNYPYILYIPESSPAESALIVETANTGNNDNLSFHIESAKATVKAGKGLGPRIAKQLSYPLLMPVFPRTKADAHMYTHALDEDTLKIKTGLLKRLDLQLLAMVKDARLKLEKKNIKINDKFSIVGFSASGTFANRFSFIHPQKIVAVVSGGINSIPMLPLASLKGEELSYPLGIGNFEDLVKVKFNSNDWRQLPQYLFMGSKDNNDAVQYNDAFSDANRKTIYKALAEDMQDRWFAAQKIYFNYGSKATFVTYGEEGHWTNTRINTDAARFVQYYVERY